MAAGARDPSSGHDIAGGLATRRWQPHVSGGRKQGSSNGVGEVGGGGHTKRHAREHGIEGHGGQIKGEGDWIVVCGCRIQRAGVRINGHGYGHMVAMDGAPAVQVAVDGSTGMEVVVNKAMDEELAPEVQARLERVLAGIDPVYHATFISLYKVMVPALFKSK
ncbi:hypothetical protein HU200_064625 [Digitaria exilis]|uniref:Uncharacterized protein n=1 Tax=Digitaria exilis TaxID=1010633 RepID=A0A835A3S9_9POAL|nr:hypothetical protein HU200_064625 [Digitaria exilis]